MPQLLYIKILFLFSCVQVCQSFAIATGFSFLRSHGCDHLKTNLPIVCSRNLNRWGTMKLSAVSDSSLLAAYPELDSLVPQKTAPEVDFHHGRLKPFGPSGEITNDCSMDLVPPHWQPLVSGAIDAFREAALESGLTLASVYLGGSVPRGLAIDGRSDLSMFGYFVPPPGVHSPTILPPAPRERAQTAVLRPALHSSSELPPSSSATADVRTVSSTILATLVRDKFAHVTG